jgi:hypothetical protein
MLHFNCLFGDAFEVFQFHQFDPTAQEHEQRNPNAKTAEQKQRRKWKNFQKEGNII